MAIVLAAGASSCSNSSRFPPSAPKMMFTPVTLPPGRLRLATKPIFTASPPLAKIIGIEDVTDFAARPEAPPPTAAIPLHGGRPGRSREPAAGHSDRQPNEIRSQCFCPRRARFPRGTCETPLLPQLSRQTNDRLKIRSPAASARAPRAATLPLRRRAAYPIHAPSSFAHLVAPRE